VTLISCIASSRADCVFGVARLISSARTTLAKIGPGWNSKNVPPCVLLHDVRADDVGRHQVRRELDARELEVEHVGQRVDELVLPRPGTPSSSTWPPASRLTIRRATSRVMRVKRSRN
jgi:hypothetical protein